MDSKDTLTDSLKTVYIGTDAYYYKYIFKKTEKIICAVFYTVRSTKDRDDSDITVKDIEDVAHQTMRLSLQCLRSTREEGMELIKKLGYSLVELESSLRILNAARLISNDILDVFINEIDSVNRTIGSYIESNLKLPAFAEEGSVPRDALRGGSRRRAITEAAPSRRRVDLSTNEGVNEPSRRERVIAVLRDKGQASIKDVIDVVTDCSEKTIQRELNALIKDNLVTREGERRWSRYSLSA